MIDVALLGTGGMMPLPYRFLTSLYCRLNGRFIMIDCGEGTQVSLKMLGWGFKNIDAICFTHFHADHISGLPGLLLTIGNAGREEPLTLFGPTGLGHVVKCLRVIASDLPFEIVVRELSAENPSRVTGGGFLIETLPVEHRGSCLAYSLSVNRRGRFDLERAIQTGIPKEIWSPLQKQGRIEYNGRLYTDDCVLGPPRRGLKISYCTDTRPTPQLPDFIRDSDLFICEGLYGEDDKLNKAWDHGHMVFSQAARIAKDGGASELWLTHYSPAMTEPEQFINAAREIFGNSHAGRDRMNKTLRFSGDE